MKRMHILDNQLWIELIAMLIAVNGLFFYLADGDGSKVFYLGSFMAGIWLLVVFLKAPMLFLKEHVIELVFCGVCVCGIVLNTGVSDVYSWIRLVEVVIFMVALTSNPANMTYEKGRLYFCWMARILVVITFALMIGSLILQIFHIAGIFECSQMKYFHDEVFGGLYGNGNRLAIHAFVSLLLSIYLYENKKNTFDLLNIGLEVCGIMLSGCRSVILTCLVLLIVFHKEIFEKISNEKKRKLVRKVGLLIVLLGVGGLVLATVSKSGMYFQHGFGDPNWWMDKLSGGRFNVWKEAYAVSKTSPVFGVGLNNIRATAAKMLPETAVYNARGYENAHNMVINLLAYTGYAGLLTAGLLFAKYVKIVRSVVRKNSDMRVLMVLLIGLLMIDQLDIVITFSNYMPVYVFYLILGLFQLCQRRGVCA